MQKGLVILIIFGTLLITFLALPEQADIITDVFGSVIPIFLDVEAGSGTALFLSSLFLLIIIGSLHVAVYLSWILDTRKLYRKMQTSPELVAMLLGHDTNAQTLRSSSVTLGLATFLLQDERNVAIQTWIERKYGVNLWDLIFIVNYIQILETGIRQLTQAPTHILEHPIAFDVEDIRIPRGADSPFTNDEIEIIDHNISANIDYGYLSKFIHWAKSSRIKLSHLLIKGIANEDYDNGNLSRFVELLKRLAGVGKDVPPIVNVDAIASIVRLADKQFDFKLSDENDGSTHPLWTIGWNYRRGTGKQIRSNAVSLEPTVYKGNIQREFDIYELSGCADEMQFVLKENPDQSPTLGKTCLEISGYHIATRSGERNVIKIIDNKEYVEVLERRERLVLSDIFEGEICGNILRLEDPCNIRMLIEGFLQKQNTIASIAKAVDSGSERDIALALLRCNALGTRADSYAVMDFGSRFFQLQSLDDITSLETVTSCGLLGLNRLNDDVKKMLSECIQSQTQKEIQIPEKSDHTVSQDSIPKRYIGLPQLELTDDSYDLRDTRKTEEFANSHSLVYCATGGGAWIIHRNHMRYFTRPRMQDERRGLLLIHFPLRESTFLEALTHRNYHYVEEILTNRIEFQKKIRERKGLATLEFVWCRESFLPSGNCFVLDDKSREILDRITDTHVRNESHRPDYGIMLTRSNQLIRGPVNGINMIFVENSQRPSPLPSMTLDHVLRQRILELVSECFSKDEGLVEDGRPTNLCYAINWLRPLQPGESFGDEVRFDVHAFSRPSTWNHLGFLDTIVKETKCAYSLLKVLAEYRQMLKTGEPLPFKLVQNLPQSRVDEDIEHLDRSYSLLCDFLAGQGDFSKPGITAIGQDDGYLDWLKSTLSQLPEVGKALGAERPFIACVDECKHWLAKLDRFLEETRDPLQAKVSPFLLT